MADSTTQDTSDQTIAEMEKQEKLLEDYETRVELESDINSSMSSTEEAVASNSK